jgi:hypothetical protein
MRHLDTYQPDLDSEYVISKFMLPEYEGKDAFAKVWDGDEPIAAYSPQVWVGWDHRLDLPQVGYAHLAVGTLLNREGDVRLNETTDYLGGPLRKAGVNIV